MTDKWNRPHETFVAEANRYPRKLARLKAAASLIEPGSRVLDLGCGSMLLREFLPRGCTYVPADLYADRHPEIIPVDLNKGEFPESSFDVVVMLAVLGVVTDKLGLLRKIRERSPKMILTSASLKRGWRTFPQLDATGWKVERNVKLRVPLLRRLEAYHAVLLCS